MPAAGVIASFQKLKDVRFSRSDASPVQDLDSPIWYSSASKIYMGPVSGGGGGGGSFSLGVSTGGNTLGLTGVTGSRVVLVGAGAITASQSVDPSGATITLSAPPQSVQSQNRFNLTLNGNTAGALQEVSSGTLSLAGGANITLSQNGNAITISGNAGGGTQTAISGVANSETTYTSGTVRLSELGNLTIRSTTGQAFQLSVAPQSVQPETQTFVGGISASDALYTSGTVRITGVGGGVTVSSNTGQRIDISVAAPVAQTGTQFTAGVSGGNTSGNSGTVNGRLVLAGGNNITLSGSTNGVSMSVTISGPNAAGAQTGISGIAASDTTYTSGSVTFTGSGIVTVQSGTGQRVIINASQSVQTQDRFDLTLSGNTSGVLALVSSGTLTLAGGNNITVSQAGNAITISGANAAGAQTGISGIIASNTTFTSGSVRFTGVGGGITVSSNTGQRVDLSVAAPINFSAGVSTGGNTDGATGVSGTRLVLVGEGVMTLSQTTGAAGNTVSIQAPATSVLSAVAPLSTSTNGSTISILGPPSFSAGASTMGNTLGNTGLTGSQLVFAGINNITLSQSSNASGATLTISGPSVAGAQTGISGIIASDATYTSGTVEITGSGIVTIRSSAGQRVVVDASQSVQTVGMYALGNTTGQSSSTTRDARSLSVEGAGIVSVGYSGGSLRISATQSVQPETQTFVGGLANSQTTYTSGTISLSELGAITIRSTTGNQFQLSVAAQTAESQSIGMSNVGNTSGTTGVASGAQVRFVIAGGNSITLSQSLNGASGTLTISGPNISESIGMSNVGNTSGTTGVASGPSVRFVLAGGNNITLSQSLNGASGTLTISAPNQSAQTLGMYAVQNTTGQSSSTTMDARTLSVAGDGIVSVGYSAGSLRISASQSVQPETQTFIAGISASDTLYTSGNVRFTGVGGGITVSSNTGQRVDLSVAAQSVQTQNLIDVTLSGNTSGVQALISSGTMTLAGGNNITVSQNGNAVTISGPNVGGAQTGISALANSETTYTSGSVTFSQLGAITIRSTTGQHFQLSVDPQSVQTVGLYALGNTTGQSSSTTRDARSISVEGAGIISVGYSGGSLRISATQSVQPETQTFIGGISASDTLYTSGSVRFTGVGGGVTVSSNTGQRVDISVAAQSEQTQSRFNLTISGNTSGAGALVSSGVLTLAGGNNVTLSQAGNAITISGGAGGAFSGGVSNVGNTVGDTGITGSRLVLAGGNAITLSQSTNASGGTVTISAADQTNQTLGLYAVGNTTGQSSSTTRDARSISVDGAGAVSVGYSGGTLRISAPVQTAQTGLSGLANSQTTYTSGTVSLSELGAITIRSTTGNQFQLSVNAQTGTQFSLGLSNIGNTAGDTVTVGGRVILAGGNGITLSGSSNGVSQTITISGITQSVQTQSLFSAGVSTGGNTAGDTGVTGTRMVFVGSQNITLSQATAAAGGTITIQGPVTAAQTADSGGVYAVGNTYSSSSGTFDVRTLSIRGDGIISVAATNSGWRISASQSVQAETQTFVGGLAASNTTYTSGTITITGVGGGVTVSSNTGQRIDISVAAQTVESQSIGASNLGNTLGTSGVASGGQVRAVIIGTSNITVSQSVNGASATLSLIGQPSFSAGLSTGGNTQGNTGVSGTRLVLVATNNITMSQNTDANGATISISGQSPTGGQFSAGVSNLGNSAGATGITGSQLVLVGTNNITLSQTTGANGATISISGPAAGGFSAGVSTGGNTTGDTGMTATRLVLAGIDPITLSQATGANGATVSIDGPATSSLVGASGISVSTNGSTISVYQPNRSKFYPFNDIPIVTGQQGQATLHISPLHFPNVQHDRVALAMQISNATNSSNSITMSAWVGLYSQNASSISLISSTSGSTNFTGSGTVGSFSLYGGPKLFTIPWTNTITEGDYFFGIVVRTTTGGGAGHTISQLCVSKFTNSAWSGIIGAATGATDQYQLGLGVYTVSTSGIPVSIAFTQINGSGSMALREPVFQLVSGTV